ncbi:Fructosamine kinase-domain-containing protein [Pseudomassariella vexata]|uniref:protein-ribulosamine 3-kinase n=1 Tax=Pseudomassariella vexata TaxID=1141098 RepID=A0A1Y2DCF7_9PEZI|nr:Fructosamine kinase-domain-containing protein [Pseudomassariella vexata]ORY56950.1 Fructosamine kinase-domain-containing protein [Pseudomassariella vexata]
MPLGTKVLSAVSSGVSVWAKTAKISVMEPDGSPKRYFLKVASGWSAKALVEGEYESQNAIEEAVGPGFGPKARGWGEFDVGGTHHYFFLGDFHDLDMATAPEPAQFVEKIAQLDQNGRSPNGKFGFHCPTVCGMMQRTVPWEEKWADSFTHLLKDVIRCDNDANPPWPEYDVVCQITIDKVIPRVLGALQSDGRSIEPVLIHGDVWEQNVGIDMETGETLVFDPGCTYAHNEMEFGTWKGSWALYFNNPIYQRLYQCHIPPSEPAEEWDDRNRIYALHININDSAGHPGSTSRQVAYNDMLYLIEKYFPDEAEGLKKYDPQKDITVTGAYVPHVVHQLE